MAMNIPRKKIRVCVIGAGAAGLCAARHLSHDFENFEAAIFEQSDKIGGTWNYNDISTISNETNFSIHTSMYKNLRTNIPLKLMNFPDFQLMNQERPSCGTHEQVLDYLKNYANNFNLSQYIQFNTRIEHIEPQTNNENSLQTTWRVRIKYLTTEIIEDQIFDAILVCNGHFSTPKIPILPGIGTFTGDTMHSHNYRIPEKFKDKIVIVLGAGPSGIDIGIEICDHAQHVYLSHNNPRFTSQLPSNMTQVQGIESVNGNNFILKDGEIVNANSLLYCTGYCYTFPFLSDDCKIKVNGNHITPLYKHLINVEYPRMAIIGIPSSVIPFPLFHYQIQFFLAVLLNHVTLPSKESMLEDSKSNDIKHPHKLADAQWEYNNNFAVSAHIEKLPSFYQNGYNKIHSLRLTNVLEYKNSALIIENDGETVYVNI